jgi:hypothetical protein
MPIKYRAAAGISNASSSISPDFLLPRKNEFAPTCVRKPPFADLK